MNSVSTNYMSMLLVVDFTNNFLEMKIRIIIYRQINELDADAGNLFSNNLQI